MVIDPFLLEILVCPENKTAVVLLGNENLHAANTKIKSGQVRNRAGNPVLDELDGGLLRADKKFLYPIRKDIPIMLIDEGIATDQLDLKI
jgi:uncharacterized protein YbaR (Trm112 family)